MSHGFAPAVLDEVSAIADRYPRREAALLPVLRVLQKISGVLGRAEEELAAELLGLEPVRVREVVTFYSLFKQKPAGRHIIRVCINLSCSMAGAERSLAGLQTKLGIGPGETTPDGRFTLLTVECLGNCDQAPCLMVDDDDHGRVQEEQLDEILGRYP
jgi:NADH-quinone oxidoreductase subunit E